MPSDNLSGPDTNPKMMQGRWPTQAFLFLLEWGTITPTSAVGKQIFPTTNMPGIHPQIAKLKIGVEKKQPTNGCFFRT
jgi:hypothetical protein